MDGRWGPNLAPETNQKSSIFTIFVGKVDMQDLDMLGQLRWLIFIVL